MITYSKMNITPELLIFSGALVKNKSRSVPVSSVIRVGSVITCFICNNSSMSISLFVSLLGDYNIHMFTIDLFHKIVNFIK